MAEKSIKVSIVIPIYRVEDQICSCLKSVLNQTYRHLEVILVDDCSDDRSMRLAMDLIHSSPLAEDLLFVFLHHDHNYGLSAARNTGTRSATGDYVLYLDSDDRLSDECVLKMVCEVEKHPEVEMVQGMTVSVPFLKKYDMSRYRDIGYKEDNTWIRYHFFQPSSPFPVNAWNKLIKLNFLRENKLDFYEGIIREDEHWMFRMVRCLHSFSVIPYVTYFHDIRQGSIMNRPMADELSKESIRRILIDLIPTIDRPYPFHQLNKLFIYENWYENLGGTAINDVRKAFLRCMWHQGWIQMAFLYYLYMHLSFVKGGQRFKQRFDQYLISKLEAERVGR